MGEYLEGPGGGNQDQNILYEKIHFSVKKNRFKKQILSSPLVAYSHVGHSILELTCSNMILVTGKDKCKSTMQDLGELLSTV